MEFKDIKLVEKLQNLKYLELVRIIAVNRFGPDRLEMVSVKIGFENWYYDVAEVLLCTKYSANPCNVLSFIQGLWKLLNVEGVQLRGHSLSSWENSNISICHFGKRNTELYYITGGSAPVYNLNAHLEHLLKGFSFRT